MIVSNWFEPAFDGKGVGGDVEAIECDIVIATIEIQAVADAVAVVRRSGG